jgi:hypothetical protein
MRAACSAPRAAQQPSTSGRCTLAAARGARGLGAAALPRRPALRARQQQQLAVCSLTSHPGEEHTGSSSQGDDLLAGLNVPTTAMAKNLGSSGGGSATLQRSKLSNKQSAVQRSPKLDDGMGGGGIGKGIFNGGGGDGDGGDDDDYFNEFGDGDGDGGDDGFFRKVFKELYDAKAIQAVLQEWYKTMGDMPLILRQAAQMGLFSSAALVRFLSMDVRPNVTRFITRSLPPSMSREVVGRLMADPAFVQKLVLEQMITVGSTLVYEAKVRGDRFWSELDLVASNVLCLSAANAALVYLVAPTRAAPAPGRFEWQNQLAKLPNNVFEATTPLREYTTGSRAAAFFIKSAELCGVGMLAGAAQSALAQAAVALRRQRDPSFQPSMPVPSVQQSALGFAAAQGIFANVRYQMVAGIDRYLFDHANYLWSYLGASGAFRAVSTAVGDQTRRYLQGLPNGDAVMRRRAALRAWVAQQAAQARGGVVVRTSPAPAPAAAPAATSSSSGAAAGGKKKRRSKKPAGGFEMGVGPAAAPVAA